MLTVNQRADDLDRSDLCRGNITEKRTSNAKGNDLDRLFAGPLTISGKFRRKIGIRVIQSSGGEGGCPHNRLAGEKRRRSFRSVDSMPYKKSRILIDANRFELSNGLMNVHLTK